MKPHVKEILGRLIGVFHLEMERLSKFKGAKPKRSQKKISTRYFFLHANLKNIADGLFAVLETIAPEDRIDIMKELIASWDKKLKEAEMEEFDSFSCALMSSALVLAGYPWNIVANIKLITPNGKNMEQRAEKALDIIFSLSPQAKKAIEQQNIKISKPFNIDIIKKLAHKPVIVENIQPADTIMPVAAEAEITETVQDEPGIREAVQNELEQKLFDAANEMDEKYRITCKAAIEYVNEVLKALEQLYQQRNFSKDFTSEGFNKKIDAMHSDYASKLLEIEGILSDINSKIPIELIYEYVDTAGAIYEKIEEQREELKNIFVAVKSNSNFTFTKKTSSLWKKLITALDMLKAALLKLRSASQAVINYVLKGYPDHEVEITKKSIQYSSRQAESSEADDKNKPLGPSSGSPRQDL